jgi:hypothetical protein
MTAVAVVFVSLALLFILFKKLEDRIRHLIGWQKHSQDRLSSLEVKDYAQDYRLDNHRDHIQALSDDIGALSRDIGWDDDKLKTQVIKTDPDDNV